MTENRNHAIDILKGLGIVIVVAIHSGLPSIFWHNFLNAFQMAIFIFCSGFCFNSKYLTMSPRIYIRKKIKTLYVPYTICNILLLLLNNFFVMSNIYTDKEEFLTAQIGISNFFGLRYKMDFLTLLKEIGAILLFGRNGEPQLGGTTWFLRVLFIISLVFFIVQYLCYKLFKENYFTFAKWIHLVLAALLLSIGWTGQTHNWKNMYSLLTCCSIYFIYVAGWLLAQTNICNKLNGIYPALITIILCFLTLYIVTPTASIGISANSYSSIAHLVIASLAGTILCFSVSIQIQNLRGLRAILCNWGASLYIMMFHFVAFKLVTILQITYYKYPSYYLASFPVLYPPNWFWRTLYIIAGCFIPFILGKGISKITAKKRQLR